jgi:hypothetical protein
MLEFIMGILFTLITAGLGAAHFYMKFEVPKNIIVDHSMDEDAAASLTGATQAGGADGGSDKNLSVTDSGVKLAALKDAAAPNLGNLEDVATAHAGSDVGGKALENQAAAATTGGAAVVGETEEDPSVVPAASAAHDVDVDTTRGGHVSESLATAGAGAIAGEEATSVLTPSKKGEKPSKKGEKKCETPSNSHSSAFCPQTFENQVATLLRSFYFVSPCSRSFTL